MNYEYRCVDVLRETLDERIADERLVVRVKRKSKDENELKNTCVREKEISMCGENSLENVNQRPIKIRENNNVNFEQFHWTRLTIVKI